jgi:uncharacterized protein (TIGR02246 family)
MAAADIVARQVDAYNAHDLEAFLACYTDDVVVTSGNGDLLLEGGEAVRDQYGVMFERLPDVQVTVRHRIELGAWVVDDEHVTAAAGFEIEALVAYHVPGDHIDRVVVMTAEREE